MYLMTRRTRLSSAEGLEWAVSILGRAKEVTGNEIQLWGTVYSAGFGTVSWTSWWADLGSMETAFAALEADEAYRAAAAEGRAFTNGVLDDGLLETVAGEPDPESQASYVGAVEAVCAAGNIVRAMTAGVEIAQKAEAITGIPTMFLRGLTGPYGAIGWLTPYVDLNEMGVAQDKLAADPSWLTLIDSTQGCFVEEPLVTQQTMYRRLA